MTKKQCRLINPSKTELGIISKNLIKNIVSNVIKKTNYNLWKNFYDAIKWFKNIKNKVNAIFIQFDFNQSITKE